MITENGIVTSTNNTRAWIKTVRSSACESCSSKESCGTAENRKEMIVCVQNTLNVQQGDHVVIGMETSPMLYLTFFLYVFPIIMLIAGALIGNNTAPYFKFDPSLFSMLIGFLFFGIAFLVIRGKNRSLSQKDSFKPFLVRKKSQAVQANCSLS